MLGALECESFGAPKIVDFRKHVKIQRIFTVANPSVRILFLHAPKFFWNFEGFANIEKISNFFKRILALLTFLFSHLLEGELKINSLKFVFFLQMDLL